MKQPLKGILVLEFTQFITDLFMGLKLENLVSKVIKIERPDFDETRKRINLKNLFLDRSTLNPILIVVLILSISFINIQRFWGQKSTATIRLEGYKESGSCIVTNPKDEAWNIEFERTNLLGDLAPNMTYTRRDPSSVLKVNGKFYVWYSYSLTYGAGKISPWDLNDLYYATSTDSYTWTEQGIAVGRGSAGSYDYRSAFTTEVFYHNEMFYLIYQASDSQANLNKNNTIAMAYSVSPDGPWTKLEEPLLYPSSSESVAFDKNAVHDPCIVHFNNKFYMYYKGEGNEQNTCGVGIWGNKKQVKWGVAIADNITGPYVKSEQNPISNTGHEVCVWNSGDGIGIMLHQDGPEYGTTQYSNDGINFEIKGEVDFPFLKPYQSTYPEAAGLYRHINQETSPVSGVSWGLSHVLLWDGPGWMHLKRFENKNKQAVIYDADNQGIIIDETASTSKNFVKQVNVYPNPTTDNIYIKGAASGIYSLKIINLIGNVINTQTYDATNNSTVNISNLSKGLYILRLINTENSQIHQLKFIKK